MYSLISLSDNQPAPHLLVHVRSNGNRYATGRLLECCAVPDDPHGVPPDDCPEVPAYPEDSPPRSASIAFGGPTVPMPATYEVDAGG